MDWKLLRKKKLHNNDVIGHRRFLLFARRQEGERAKKVPKKNQAVYDSVDSKIRIRNSTMHTGANTGTSIVCMYVGDEVLSMMCFVLSICGQRRQTHSFE